MARHVPPSIEEIGLSKYLDSTKSTHNSRGYKDFVQMAKLEVAKTKIAEAFGVDRKTIMRWLDLYHKELDNA